MKNTDKAKSKRRRCASRTTLSELKQLHKEIKDYLEGLRA